MALTIKIPATPLDIFKTNLVHKFEATWYPGVVRRLMAHYGPIFREVEAMHNVPAAVMCTLVSIENPDASDQVTRARMERFVTGPKGSGATGLCQIDCKTADEALRDDFATGNLGDEEAAFFRQKLGARFDSIVHGGAFGRYTANGNSLVHTTKDLADPRYNVHIGALRFGQLLRLNTGPDGVMRLDRAIVRYNGSAAPLPPVGASVAQVLASQKGKNHGRDKNTTYKYILKFIGTGGGMDLLTRAGRTV